MTESIKRAIGNESSPVYQSTNPQEISDYLLQKGIDVGKEEIKNYLEKEVVSTVKYKNQGLQKIAQVSKSFVQRGKFFATCHADTMVLSASRNYKTKKKYLLLCICQLSRYLFLEPTSSLKYAYQKRAWEKIFERMKTVFPSAKVSTLVTDAGIEFSLRLKAWLDSLDIKLNVVARRPFRLSRGASVCEAAIKRVRFNLEKQMLLKSQNQSYEETLRKVEFVCNNQYLSSIEMSAVTALQHEPMYIVMKSETMKLKKRKYLRQALIGMKEIEKFTIVRVKKFQEKMFTSTRKESYGFESPCFMVLDVVRDRPLPSYKLCDLFTLSELPGLYSSEELSLTKLSYLDACNLEQKNIVNVIKVKNGIVRYTVASTDRVFVAGKSLIE